MANKKHADLIDCDIHTLIKWSHADEAARLAEVVTAADIGKLSCQADNNSYWLLSEVGPDVWTELSNTSVIDLDIKVSTSATDTTAGYLDDKITVSSGVTKTILNPGGAETLDIDIDESGINHDLLNNYVASHHTDWSLASQGTIHASNYVDNDTIYTHPNHTGEVTSVADGVQTLDKTAITNKTAIGADGADYVLVSDTDDSGNLKKVLVSELLDDTDTGQDNTASNVGTAGVGTFKQKTGVDLEFKNINAGSNKVSITDDVANSEIDIDLNLGNIDHDSLLNYDAGEHVDWSLASQGTIHSSNYVDNDTTNHTLLSNIGVNTHVQIDNHLASTLNPHSVTFTQAVTADSGTDITAAEAETLTDGSNADLLHVHTASAITDFDTEVSNNTDVNANTTNRHASGSDNQNLFETIVSPNGGNIVADSQTDTLTLTSSDSSITITNTPGTDTIDFIAVGGGGGLETKAGVVPGSSFTVVSGDRIFDVVFSTAFADANYSVTLTANEERSWTYENKTASGFRINLHSASDFTGYEMSWQAIKSGES